MYSDKKNSFNQEFYCLIQNNQTVKNHVLIDSWFFLLNQINFLTVYIERIINLI